MENGNAMIVMGFKDWCGLMLMSSDCRVGDQPASLQAIPSARVPAGGPGQPSTPHRFSAGPCHRCKT
ncbi:hypothetical protein B2M27_06195 [Kluyvera intermedia]|uniref:Uncharacterized protein n=1 Tax=Kluyvera intermedia TaxID=61648 RepID=A0ABX3UIP3_KLUIN|nr:hypothetical protein B2M27_06195 [Kluyvera intermedia]